jgi:hypothetical protein
MLSALDGARDQKTKLVQAFARVAKWSAPEVSHGQDLNRYQPFYVFAMRQL